MFKRHNCLVHSRVVVVVVVTIISRNSSSCIVDSIIIIFFYIKLVSHSTSCFHRFKIVKQPHGKKCGCKVLRVC